VNDSKKNSVEESLVKTTTLGELGFNLPLGIPDGGGGLVRSFALRPWRFKEEKELAELIEQNPDATLAQYVSMVVATLCSSIGPHDFSQMKWEEKLIVIGQMWMGDVFFIYITLRKEAIGNVISLAPKCPGCGRNFNFDGHLDSINVLTTESVSNAQWEYKLNTPIEMRGKTVGSFTLGPPRWNTLEMMTDDNSVLNVGAKLDMIRGSIHAVDSFDQQIVVIESDLDELTKKDMETISAEIDEKVVGPDMFVETKCPNIRCRNEIKQLIDWRYQHFFGVSSR